jgi:hypothetical protein
LTGFGADHRVKRPRTNASCHERPPSPCEWRRRR